MEKLINLILYWTKGKKISNLGNVSSLNALIYLFHRGAIPALRGIFYKLILRQVKGIIFIGSGVKIYSFRLLFAGSGVYIGDYCHLNCYSTKGVHLGNNVTIREFGWIQLTSTLSNPGSQIIIGNDTYIGPRSILGAGAELIIGERCQIGANVSFIAESHLFLPEDEIFNQGVTRKGISIGNDCWIGNNSIILDGVNVGDGVVIGAGSIVTRDVPERSVIVGNPARVIKVRSNN